MKNIIKDIKLNLPNYKKGMLTLSYVNEDNSVFTYEEVSNYAKLIYNLLNRETIKKKDYKYYFGVYKNTEIRFIRAPRSEWVWMNKGKKDLEIIWEYEDGVKEHEILWNLKNNYYRHFIKEARDAGIGPAKLLTVIRNCKAPIENLLLIFEIGPKTLKELTKA